MSMITGPTSQSPCQAASLRCEGRNKGLVQNLSRIFVLPNQLHGPLLKCG